MHFDNNFLCTAHILFLDADIEICKHRVRERIAQRRNLDDDDHFVPDNVIECFGQESCKKYIGCGLKLDFGIADDRVRVLDTNESIEKVTDHVRQFVETLLPVLVS